VARTLEQARGVELRKTGVRGDALPANLSIVSTDHVERAVPTHRLRAMAACEARPRAIAIMR
jgi:hypothetical protein